MKKLAQYGSWLAAIVLLGLSPALMGPTGGFPSRPLFQAVGIGGAAGTTGTLTATGTGNVTSAFNTSGAASTSIVRVQNTNTSAHINLCVSGAAGGCVTGDTAGDGALRSSNGTLNFSLDNGTTQHGFAQATNLRWGNNATVTPQLQVNGASGQGIFQILRAGTSKARFGVDLTAGGCITGTSQDDVCIRSEGGAVNFSVDAGVTKNAQVAANGLTLTGSSSPKMIVNDTSAATGTAFAIQKNGTFSAFFCEAHAANTCSTGTAANDMVLRNDAGSTLVFSAGGGAITDMTPSESTSFTLDYTNDFSGAVSQTARCYRIGKVVTITTAAAATGTSTTATFDDTTGAVPATCRPSSGTVTGQTIGASNATATASAVIQITTGGNLSFQRCGAVTGTCVGGGWTNSGTKGIDPWSFTFVR